MKKNDTNKQLENFTKLLKMFGLEQSANIFAIERFEHFIYTKETYDLEFAKEQLEDSILDKKIKELIIFCA